MADLLKAVSERKTLNVTWDELRRTPADFDADEVADSIVRRIGAVIEDEPA